MLIAILCNYFSIARTREKIIKRKKKKKKRSEESKKLKRDKKKKIVKLLCGKSRRHLFER